MLRKKLTLSQLKKYDINQKVLESLADTQSRIILFSTIKEGKTAMELSEQHKIPLSSVYKKITDLEDLALVKIDKVVLSESGKKFKLYKSRISKAEITIRKPEPAIILTPNDQT